MIKISAVHDAVAVLSEKATTLHDLVANATYDAELYAHSNQTWYGIAEAMLEDVKIATELVVLATNKANAIVNPTAVV